MPIFACRTMDVRTARAGSRKRNTILWQRFRNTRLKNLALNSMPRSNAKIGNTANRSALYCAMNTDLKCINGFRFILQKKRQ